VPIEDAIKAYLFNSMLVQMPDSDRLTLIAPLETQENAATKVYCEKLVASNGPIGEVRYVDVRQSMRNGGGPACLRLRVALTENEWSHVNAGNKFSPNLYEALKSWVETHYKALDELTRIMGLGSDFYPFQR